MRYLFIGAHADDIEIGCGGAMLKAYKKNQIFNYIATDSEYNDENGKLVRSAEDAKKKGYNFTKIQLKKWNLKYHNLIFGKPSYDLFIDDKNLSFTNNWEKKIRDHLKIK